MLNNLLQDLKKDIEKEIELNIDIPKLAQLLYPYLKELQNKDIENIMQRHRQQLYNQIKRK